MDSRIFKSYSNVNQNRTDTGAIYGLDAIKQDIINLANTRKGAFPGDVQRGLLINDYIFQPELNAYEENLILEDARTQFSNDPRFRIDDIYLIADAETHTLIMAMNIYVYPFNQEVELSIPFRNE